MIDEIEIDLERSRTIRHRRRRQSARRDVERHMPGMIEPGRSGQPNLADDLGPELQRRTGSRHAAVGNSGHGACELLLMPGPSLPAVKAEGVSRIHGAFRSAARFSCIPGQRRCPREAR